MNVEYPRPSKIQKKFWVSSFLVISFTYAADDLRGEGCGWPCLCLTHTTKTREHKSTGCAAEVLQKTL